MAYSNTERAENYRLIATGLHVLARAAKHEESKCELLDLARRYQQLADMLEARELEHRHAAAAPEDPMVSDAPP
jgi:hypothetical protein